MQKLKAANLYRSDLIPISGKLVERYNKCLVKLGFSKTKLKSFSIDKKGMLSFSNNTLSIAEPTSVVFL